MSKIGIIVNANSKLYRERPEKIDELSQISGDGGIFKLTKDLREVGEIARDFKKKGVGLLVISGGDGTSRLTLTKFIEVYGSNPLPPVALIRGGTMNTAATSLMVKGSPARLLSKLMEKYKKGKALKIVERNLLRVNDDFGFIFGNSIFHNFLKVYYEKAYPSPLKGFFLLTKATLSAVFKPSSSKEIFKNFRAQVTIDGHNIEERVYSCIAASTIPYIGFGFNPFPKALERKNAFHFLGFPDNPRFIVRHMLDFFLGKEIEDARLLQATTGKVTIKTNVPVGYQLDGELKIAGDVVSLSTGPRIKFISGGNCVGTEVPLTC